MNGTVYTCELIPLNSMRVLYRSREGKMQTITFDRNAFNLHGESMNLPGHSVPVTLRHRGPIIGRVLGFSPSWKEDWLLAHFETNVATPTPIGIDTAVSIGFVHSSRPDEVEKELDGTVIRFGALTEISILPEDDPALVGAAVIAEREWYPDILDPLKPMHWDRLRRSEREAAQALLLEGVPKHVVDNSISRIPGIADRKKQSGLLGPQRH